MYQNAYTILTIRLHKIKIQFKYRIKQDLRENIPFHIKSESIKQTNLALFKAQKTIFVIWFGHQHSKSSKS